MLLLPLVGSTDDRDRDRLAEELLTTMDDLADEAVDGVMPLPHLPTAEQFFFGNRLRPLPPIPNSGSYRSSSSSSMLLVVVVKLRGSVSYSVEDGG